MKPLVIAAAQSVSVAGDIKANISRHLQFMQKAADNGVQLLVFPELSLTGYERSSARQLAILPDDDVLSPLRDMAQRVGMVTVVGAPLVPSPGCDDIFIGALVLGTEGAIGVYTKQHLHPGEGAVFACGEGGSLVSVQDSRVALAICADYTHPGHVQRAAQYGAGIYAAGALITEHGYVSETKLLAGYAIEHKMAVLLANHGGSTGGWNPVGRSAIWEEDGSQVVAASGCGDLLVIARRDSNHWSGMVVAVQVRL